MRILLLITALIAFGTGVLVSGSIRSDIQIQIAATCFTGGTLMIGQIAILQAFQNVLDRLRALEETKG